MNVVEVASRSPAFDAALKLWRAESATLGFMPEGGFDDAAQAGCLLAAEAPNGSFAGYVMFRRTAQRMAAIVHLCVDPTRRGGGTARDLFEAVKARCFDCYEIRLRCRRDFAASTLWPKLGFVAVADEPGRGREGTLTTWRYEMASLPLLRMLAESANRTGAVRAVIDANVFFDLDDLGPGHNESHGLLADWLGEFVELSVTEELFNEINRRADQKDRDRQRGRARRFTQVPRNVAREEAVLPVVRKILAQSDQPSARSDARQVAMTVAAEVTFFVTRDREVLDTADALEEALGVEVMSPHEVVRRFDELRREEDYRPRRLFFGPDVTSTLARAEDVDRLADLMHLGQAAPEPKRRTLGRLRDMMASPDRFQATCIEKDGELLAAYIVERPSPERLMVPFFAVASSPLGRTAARHYAEAVTGLAAGEQRQIVQVAHAGSRVGEALAELGFSLEEDGWIKIALPVVLPPESAANEVERLGSGSPSAAPLATRVANELREIARLPGVARTRAADVERALWPAKLTATGVPSFIVPIQPRWAKDLFDRELAAGTLFGATPNLVLNCENVYYRAARPAVVTAPARVLWYVSDDSTYPQSMAIRACSHIDEVVVGQPKDLFRRFKRLGVYEWSDVFALAKQDVAKNVMAFRFSRTELLHSPISFGAAQDILKSHTGKGSQFQSPIAITEECFLSLYRRGARTDAT